MDVVAFSNFKSKLGIYQEFTCPFLYLVSTTIDNRLSLVACFSYGTNYACALAKTEQDI